MTKKKSLYIARKNAGVCVQCGTKYSLENKVRCAGCASRLAAAYHARVSEGSCVDCGGAKVKHRVRCASCLLAHNKRSKDYQRKNEKLGLCIRCGDKSRPDRVLCKKCAVTKLANKKSLLVK